MKKVVHAAVRMIVTRGFLCAKVAWYLDRVLPAKDETDLRSVRTGRGPIPTQPMPMHAAGDFERIRDLAVRTGNWSINVLTSEKLTT
jgi:hypothetical protein